MCAEEARVPRRKGETNQQWMNRLRAVRGLPPLDRDELFGRVRAAKCYIATITNPERQADVELAAFMDIFHPRPTGYTLADVRRMRA
jgi:hypothetical protein